MADMDSLKMILRESDYPFFTDEELTFYLSQNDGNLNATIYQCLNIKAEESKLSVSGLSLADTSKYFRRIALRYKPNNSGVLGG